MRVTEVCNEIIEKERKKGKEKYWKRKGKI